MIAKFYVENESGAKLDRPKLNELLDDCQQGDILLIEDIDQDEPFNGADWETLRNRIKSADSDCGIKCTKQLITKQMPIMMK